MRRVLHNIPWFTYIICVAVISGACHHNDKVRVQQNDSLKVTHPFKAPGTFQDTLMIDSPSAVFYYPDSVQLLKIKMQTDPVAYEGLEHEYFFQMRNAHIVIKKTWPALKIIDSKHYRYLLFIKTNGEKECIDLDKNNEAYGLFVFDSKKPPVMIDMSNVETGISFYLKNI